MKQGLNVSGAGGGGGGVRGRGGRRGVNSWRENDRADSSTLFYSFLSIVFLSNFYLRWTDV